MHPQLTMFSMFYNEIPYDYSCIGQYCIKDQVVAYFQPILNINLLDWLIKHNSDEWNIAKKLVSKAPPWYQSRYAANDIKKKIHSQAHQILFHVGFYQS